MIGFPGLGIDRFNIKREIFSIGDFSFNWYGLIIAAGFLLAVIYCLKRAKNFSLRQDDFIDMLIFAVPAAIIGARLYYCLFEWADFKDDLWGILRIREGGLAIYGAVIASVLTCVLFCRVRRLSVGAVLDLGAPGLLIGQAVGRWGNFFNVEVYGHETTLPWRMRVYTGTAYQDVHPLFLYEFLWNAAGFLLLHLLSKKRRFNGQLFIMYVAWYGIGRGFLEGMRQDFFVLRIWETAAASQLLAFISAVIALLLLAYHFIFKNHDPEDINLWVEKRAEWLERRKAAKESVSCNEDSGEDEYDEDEADSEDAGDAGDSSDDETVDTDGETGPEDNELPENEEDGNGNLA